MSTVTTPLSIGVLGAGNIGRPVGRHWSAAGHRVTFGSRSPERLVEFVADSCPEARTAGLVETAETNDVLLLSFPYPAWEEVLESVGGSLAGKLILDATNPMGLSDDGHIISTLAPGLTQGRHASKLLPNAMVVRAFTHVMDELLWSRGTQQRHFWGMGYAGDDSEAKNAARGLILDAGFTPVDLGGLDDSAPLDPGGSLFPHMFTPADLRTAAGLVA
ncbi:MULTISPECIES: NADPH-dependent F420 reductase [Streptomyces]|uniref:NAD(P)-binding domain-containing protein n=1 Tax=Streptomyces poriferorum TaxID=2798799 RepID=A0ABY9IFV0_9ACTN|nr:MULTISPECIES: NAD(P)-binding domain-containing protein [unclassified Streptomyces]MDP5315630.1 NAD(P)-binding domain-containing protein [Streptomyces sp. Alt4]WLQ54000.1 NAD(P)-binding domain-containing protein [Streptomyces sp. Alt2]WSI60648.1 NAD(P)-binding domain-containing protein [Streptomyces sp. NBC_01336]